MSNLEKPIILSKKNDNKQKLSYQETNWYKELDNEQQTVIDQKFKEKFRLEQKITKLKASIELKSINRDIISKGNQDKVTSNESNEKLTPYERIDLLDREIELLLGQIYNINLKKNSSELMSSFDKSNEYFKNQLLILSETNEFAQKLIESNKDLGNISSGEIYSLKQEGLNLSELFLIKLPDNKFKVNFGKNKNLNNYIGAGDLLDIYKIEEVKINGVEGKRKFSPRPGYYTTNGKYLSIFDNYDIEIISEKQITEEEEKNNYIKYTNLRYEEVRSSEIYDKFRKNLSEKGNRNFIKFEGMSQNDIDILYGFIAKYIDNDKEQRITFDKNDGVMQTVGGEPFNDVIYKIIPKESLGTGYEKYKNIVEKVAKQEKIPVEKLITLINHENVRWDPLKGNPRSSAYGLGQMLDGTWKRFGKGLDESNPEHQLIATCKFLNHIMNTKKCSIELAMAYYNTGESFLKLSDKYAKKAAKLNPPINEKIPFGMIITTDVYFTAAVAYYNNLKYREAVRLV